MPARFKSSIPSSRRYFIGVDYPFDACLDNQFGAFYAGGGSDVHGGTVTAVV